MQKIATRIFIAASVTFGVLGIIIALTGFDPGNDGSFWEIFVTKLFMVTIFVILASFAVSVASKYLKK